MLNTRVLLLCIAVLVLSGCGSGVVSPPGGGGPPPQQHEWTFDPTDTSRLGIWSTNTGASAASIALSGSGQVTVTAYTSVYVGQFAATADQDGVFSGENTDVAFSGTVTHNSASLQLWSPSLPVLKYTVTCVPISESDYNAARGQWSGTYSLSGGGSGTFALTADDAGLISGTAIEAEETKSIAGFVASTGLVRMSVTSANSINGTYLLEGNYSEAQDGTRSLTGTLTSKVVNQGITGTWTAVPAE